MRPCLSPLSLLMMLAAPAAAQTVVMPLGAAPAGAIGYGSVGGDYVGVDAGHPLPTAAKQEAVALVTANAPAPAVTLYGGDYVFSQLCSGYGTLALRVRAPDGATMQTLLTRTSLDAAGGVGVTLGTNAVVDATVSGTTGCNATLARIP